MSGFVQTMEPVFSRSTESESNFKHIGVDRHDLILFGQAANQIFLLAKKSCNIFSNTYSTCGYRL